MYNVSKLSELPSDIQIELFESNRRFYNDFEHFKNCLEDKYNYLSEFISDISKIDYTNLKLEIFNILVTYKFKTKSYIFITYANHPFYDYLIYPKELSKETKVISLNEYIEKEFKLIT